MGKRLACAFQRFPHERTLALYVCVCAGATVKRTAKGMFVSVNRSAAVATRDALRPFYWLNLLFLTPLIFIFPAISLIIFSFNSAINSSSLTHAQIINYAKFFLHHSGPRPFSLS